MQGSPESDFYSFTIVGKEAIDAAFAAAFKAKSHLNTNGATLEFGLNTSSSSPSALCCTISPSFIFVCTRAYDFRWSRAHIEEAIIHELGHVHTKSSCSESHNSLWTETCLKFGGKALVQMTLPRAGDSFMRERFALVQLKGGNDLSQSDYQKKAMLELLAEGHDATLLLNEYLKCLDSIK